MAYAVREIYVEEYCLSLGTLLDSVAGSSTRPVAQQHSARHNVVGLVSTSPASEITLRERNLQPNPLLHPMAHQEGKIDLLAAFQAPIFSLTWH